MIQIIELFSFVLIIIFKQSDRPNHQTILLGIIFLDIIS